MLFEKFIIAVFWCSIGLILYTYVFYPFYIFILIRFFKKNVGAFYNTNLPTVSIIISAYNEEKILPEKIKNLYAIDYPSDKIEFLFGSDGSDDQTNSILDSVNKPNFKAEIFKNRMGKANVLNHLVQKAQGEIFLFSDANTMFEPSTVKKIVKHFSDSSVGGVCGELILSTDRKFVGEVGEMSYWKYESWLKKMESDYKTLIGATGAVYAIRKSLFRPLPSNKAVTDDFLIPLEVVRKGYRVLYEPDAKAYEEPLSNVADEFQRKVRIGASNFNGISEFTDLLKPKYGFVAFALWSHKIIRWFVPFLLIIILSSTIILSFQHDFYLLILKIEIVFIVLALFGFLFEVKNKSLGILGFPYYFIAMNLALFVGFIRFLRGSQSPSWNVLR